MYKDNEYNAVGKKIGNAEDALRLPFHVKIANTKFDEVRWTMHVIRGLMGQGKTYWTARDFLPTLFNDMGINFAVYSVHQHEIMDFYEFASSLKKHDVYVTNDIEEAVRFSRKGDKVLLLTTHQSFAISEKGEKLINYLKTSGVKFSIWIDEVHTWLVSGKDNYYRIMGAPGNKYVGKMFKVLEELSEYTAYIFGLTATPNREQSGIVKSCGKLNFEIINDLPSREMMIGKSAWYRNIDVFNIENETEIYDSVRTFLNRIHNDELVTGTKKTVMVQCGRSNHRLGWTIEKVRELFIQIIREDDLWNMEKKILCDMTGESRKIYSPDKSKVENLGKGGRADDKVKERLNNFSDSARIVFIVDKGKAGMNVFNLGGLISFRSYDKKNDIKECVIEMAIQILGRSVRLNVGKDIDSFKKDYGYDLELFVKRVNDLIIEDLLKANCFDVLVPDISMWGEALHEFKTNYASSIEEAKVWINSVRGVCNTCGAAPEHQTK